MATVTSHTLNSVLGTHAGGIAVSLSRVGDDGNRVVVFESETDAGGRLSKIVEIATEHANADYELVFQTGRYFASMPLPVLGNQILKEVVIRFTMPDPNGSYHIPLMLAPNSYSVWWSS